MNLIFSTNIDVSRVIFLAVTVAFVAVDVHSVHAISYVNMPLFTVVVPEAGMYKIRSAQFAKVSLQSNTVFFALCWDL